MSNGDNGKAMLEVLRGALRRRPFKPFVIHLSDGERIEIGHPESALLVSGDLVMCADRHGAVYVFGGEHFVSIRFQSGQPSRPGRAGGPHLVRDRARPYRAR